jgi:hypothetical protein
LTKSKAAGPWKALVRQWRNNNNNNTDVTLIGAAGHHSQFPPMGENIPESRSTSPKTARKEAYMSAQYNSDDDRYHTRIIIILVLQDRTISSVITGSL